MIILVFFTTVLGINFSFWGIVGICRLIHERFPAEVLKKNNNKKKWPRLTSDEVAIIVPAHNEELVLDATIKSLLQLVRPGNIFIVSDGSTDRTAEIARSYGVNVLEQNPGRGKAGALEAGINHFRLAELFEAVLFVDSDTVIPPNYLKNALPFLDDPGVVAVAGYARTLWRPESHSLRQMYFISHRERIYTLNQILLKFGQSWQYTNVVSIVPGFASIYRTSVLKEININPPGLVIEDFNMTFEIHHKKLGRIAHHPSVSGYTQDPDNLRDYFRQVKRWDLGLWQTVRLHGFWSSRFWAALSLLLLEVLWASATFIILPLVIICLIISLQFPQLVPAVSVLLSAVLKLVIFGIWLPDMALSFIVGFIQKRPQYFYYAPTFLFMRFIDSIAMLYTLPKAFFTQSSGSWTSPSRRAN